MAQIDQIAQATEAGIRALIDGLLETGLCMLDFGQSHPASGGEHQMSHFWELKLLRENRPALLHGLKVGVASIMTARLYEKIRAIDRAEAADRLERARQPDRSQLADRIRSAYGRAADQVIAEQGAWQDMPVDQFEQLKHCIVEQWAAVQSIAARVPAAEQIAAWLGQVGAPTNGAALGFSDEEVAQAVEFGPYLRNRFTILRLAPMLGL